METNHTNHTTTEMWDAAASTADDSPVAVALNQIASARTLAGADQTALDREQAARVPAISDELKKDWLIADDLDDDELRTLIAVFDAQHAEVGHAEAARMAVEQALDS